MINNIPEYNFIEVDVIVNGHLSELSVIEKIHSIAPIANRCKVLKCIVDCRKLKTQFNSSGLLRIIDCINSYHFPYCDLQVAILYKGIGGSRFIDKLEYSENRKFAIFYNQYDAEQWLGVINDQLVNSENERHAIFYLQGKIERWLGVFNRKNFLLGHFSNNQPIQVGVTAVC